MGGYLVTNAQYAGFVEAGGYEKPIYWTEAREAGIWWDGRITGRWDKKPRQKPKEYASLFFSLRHIQVGITWYEMLVFTRWLDETWRVEDSTQTSYSNGGCVGSEQ
jgi:formylglycine-generating enzyme required for sulfatase activity